AAKTRRRTLPAFLGHRTSIRFPVHGTRRLATPHRARRGGSGRTARPPRPLRGSSSAARPRTPPPRGLGRRRHGVRLRLLVPRARAGARARRAGARGPGSQAALGLPGPLAPRRGPLGRRARAVADPIRYSENALSDG